MSNVIKNQNLKDDLKRIKNNVLDELQPEAIKSLRIVFDSIREVFVSCVTNLFEKRKEGGKK